MIRKDKKGLTPVIAVILLLMMTVAAAGAAFFWFVRIQSEMQGGTESYSEQLSEAISTKADVSEVDVACDDESLKIFLRNIGNTALPLSNTNKITWILKDSEQNVICNQYWNGSLGDTHDTHCQTGCESDLAVKGTREVLLNISPFGAESTQECYMGGYANNTMFYFKIDFAGTTATGGQFVKKLC